MERLIYKNPRPIVNRFGAEDLEASSKRESYEGSRGAQARAHRYRRATFLEKGYEQTTVSDIVREIEVAQGTFYYYFSSKEEILEAIIEKDITALEEDVRQIMSEKTQRGHKTQCSSQ